MCQNGAMTQVSCWEPTNIRHHHKKNCLRKQKWCPELPHICRVINLCSFNFREFRFIWFINLRMFSSYRSQKFLFTRFNKTNPQCTMQEILINALIKHPQLTAIARCLRHMQPPTHKSLPTEITTRFVRLYSEKTFNIVCELLCPSITSSKHSSTSSARSSSQRYKQPTRCNNNNLLVIVISSTWFRW